MVIAGIQRGHDANATLIIDGKLSVIVEAERVLGVKHADGSGAAAAALAAALEEIGAVPQDIDAIIIADSNRDNIEKIFPASLEKTHGEDALYSLGAVSHMTYVGGDIGVRGLKPDTPIYAVCHHLAHAVGAHFMSGFDSSAALVADGYGICAGTSAYHLQGMNWKLLPQWSDRFLLGWRYQLFGEFIRDIDKSKTLVYDLAGKVMGLQAYGNSKDVNYFKNWLSEDYQSYLDCWAAGSKKYFEDLDGGGGFTRNSTDARDVYFLDALSSMQSAFSEILCEASEKLLEETGENKIILSGGCGLNVVSNTELAKKFGAENVFVPPNAGDSGLSLGAAVIGSSRLDKYNPFLLTSKKIKRSPFLGMKVRHDIDMAAVKSRYNVVMRQKENKKYIVELANNLLSGGIIGVVQGRGEIGPRALGHRSILAYPAHPEIKDLINQKIKYREWWRPFAPVCRMIDADKYFEIIAPCPYMLYSAYVREDWCEKLPSITHVDRSARLQVIANREDNELLWDLLTHLEETTSCGVLLNTSFNLGGRPMINSTSDVIEMLDSSQLDAVLLEDELIYKGEQYRAVKNSWFKKIIKFK